MNPAILIKRPATGPALKELSLTQTLYANLAHQVHTLNKKDLYHVPSAPQDIIFQKLLQIHSINASYVIEALITPSKAKVSAKTAHIALIVL